MPANTNPDCPRMTEIRHCVCSVLVDPGNRCPRTRIRRKSMWLANLSVCESPCCIPDAREKMVPVVERLGNRVASELL